MIRRSNPSIHPHVEHLRSVHFALLILCSALAIASTSTRRPDSESALHELTSIVNGTDRLRTDFLAESVAAAIETLKPRHPAHDRDAYFELPTRERMHVQVRRCWTLLTESGNQPRWSGSKRIYSRPPPEHLWSDLLAAEVSRDLLKNLSEFRTFWEGIHRLTVVTFEMRNPFSKPWTAENSAGMPGVAKLTTSAETLCRADLEPAQVGEGSGFHWVKLTTGDCLLKNSEWRHSVTSDTMQAIRSSPIEGQPLFLKQHGLNWKTGDFQFVFPALYALPDEYQRMSFAVLGDALRRETAAPTTAFELFGAKIPEQYLLAWGLPVIAVVQLYLLLHLRAALAAGVRAYGIGSFPWIALYDDLLSRTVTFSSLVILPIAVAALLVQRHLDSVGIRSSIGSLAIIVAMIIATLAALTVWSMRTLHRPTEQKQQPSSLFE